MAKTKLNKDQLIGVLLLIAAALIFIPIPFIARNTIAGILVAAIGIYQLIK